MALKILRGLLINLPAVLDDGRMAVTLDPGTERLYVGTPSGNLRISTYPDLTAGMLSVSGSPPFTMNTLEKIALSLNNDAAFYSTMNTALANKSSLAQLASKADLAYVNGQVATINAALALKANTVDTVTLAFLTAQDYSPRGEVPFLAAKDVHVINGSVSASGSITLSKVFLYFGGAAVNFTANLPAVTPTTPVGWAFQLFKPSGAGTAVTFDPPGADTINGVAGNYVGLDADQSYILVKRTATDWRLLVVS